MKKKILAGMLTLAMVAALPVSAFAAKADGTEATAPVGTTTEGDTASTGAATVTSEDGVTFYTEDDDDAAAQTADTEGADINVWAKVLDASTPNYKIDLAWGAMKFEYNSGEGQWNTTTHTYDAGSGVAAWTTDGYVDGTNNKITVTNHSNKAVDASFAYTMDTAAFNAGEGTDNVVGNFFADNTKALAAAEVLTTTATGVSDKLEKLSLDSAADGVDAENPTGEEKAADAFFAFSGTPDSGKGEDLSTFQKVGVITVTVAPKAAN